ncbi:hypothetical protein FH5T_16195 [Draconibacterium orientale]|nr:hypothetical protein FH5T_16195 [Draconibacterium orientale]
MKLDEIKTKPKSGDERLNLHDNLLQYNLIDFWRWSASDLLSNATRGILAEFIVGTAIGMPKNNVRAEWDDYDLKTQEGIKIEVKSAAFIQSWEQNKFSSISFNIKPGKARDLVTGKRTAICKRHADIYVFCLLKHKEKSTIDPLKLEQWEFYVVPTSTINKYGIEQSKIGLNPVRKMVKPVGYSDLNETIKKSLAIK